MRKWVTRRHGFALHVIDMCQATTNKSSFPEPSRDISVLSDKQGRHAPECKRLPFLRPQRLDFLTER
jgi:hypothetical protein